MHPKRLADIASFELVRLFFTKRGLIAVAAFAICWLLILRYPVGQAVSLLSSPDAAEVIESLLGAIGLSQLLQWPEAELAVYWLIALFIFPSFCLLLCSDQTVGDRQRGTLRFLSLRASRSEIILGRFLGQLLIITTLMFLTLLATLAMLSYRDPSLFASAFLRSSGLLAYLVIADMPFIALMSFINTLVSSARLALVFAVLFFAGGKIIVGILSWQIPDLTVFNMIFPGYQLDQMAGHNAGVMLSIGLPILQSLVLLILAERVFARTSI